MALALTKDTDRLTADQKLTADLAAVGLVVTAINRTSSRFVVFARTARGLPLVAVVDRDHGDEHDEAFARLMTKATVR